MRHRVSGRHLGRSSKHRQALFKNLIVSLIDHGRLKTTQAKAKAVKGLTDKLITRAKKGTVHSRRILGSFLHNKKTVNKLVDEIAPKFKNRNSGFTRIVRLGRRRGDDAMMASIELVDSAKKVTIKKAVKETKKVTKDKSKTKVSSRAELTKAKTRKAISKVPTTRRTTHK